jgi:RNA-splicing ligase RtcB
MKTVSTTIKGKYNSAIIYTEDVDNVARVQIKDLCDYAPFRESKIRIMCDVHAGKGCTIGTTMTLTDKVVPSMVGVDIGCGMHTVQLGVKQIDYAKLDEYIHKYIPSGIATRDKAHPYAEQIDLGALRCARRVHLTIAEKSIGTLGGGNHFIEIDRDDDDNLYLVVHTGSRHLGTDVAEYYQRAAYNRLAGKDVQAQKALIEALKSQGREKEIQTELEKMAQKTADVPYEFAYVADDLYLDYLNDMRITQRFAALNRQAIADDIINALDLSKVDEFETVHNYIDLEHGILRKGAVSAMKGERLLIPLNMRDGSLMCIGKGNEDWNYSAPHGAGRKLSRNKARYTLSLAEYQKQMQGIYTTSVNKNTLDESPMAYKSMYEIMQNVRPTVAIQKRILPTYNFKAPE